ncbi:MAG TPA: OsmC family protein [Candidatus Eisenbacteria bacterium]|nr:OsmC family protein [Candidatus Eisenbacteria bacterium]
MRAATERMDETMNGLDLARLEATMETMDAEPSRASFTFRARNSWMEGGRTRSMIADHDGMGATHLRPRPHVLISDEPRALLGRDGGASPVEHLLHALAGCLTRTLVYHAAARGVELHEVHTNVEGTMDARGMLGVPGGRRKGFTEIRVAFDVKSEASEREIEELMLLARRHSPAFEMLANPTEVKVMRRA